MKLNKRTRVIIIIVIKVDKVSKKSVIIICCRQLVYSK